MIILITFWSLILVTVIDSKQWKILCEKSIHDWILDVMGLCIQGIVIPLLQLVLVYQIYQVLVPQLHHVLFLSPVWQFLISFIAIDYLYYWNHRLLHNHWLWPLHQVHHTVTQFDVVGTSRNSLWTSFFILYLWIHALFIYLLQDANGYLFGVSLTASFDLWRHSSITFAGDLHHILARFLILPQDHALHHSTSATVQNYGANLKLWDQIHGTYTEAKDFPKHLGVKIQLKLWQKILLPF
ncbi:MAG: sterol desaturase family protein [Microcoleaceae cyanobacterium]